MKIYLASAFDQRWWIRAMEPVLEAEGWTVLSTWQWITDDEANGMTHFQEGSWAERNFQAVHEADVLLLFVQGESSGGRWTEMGMAIAEGKTVIVVGESRNVFCRLPQVHVVGEGQWIQAVREVALGFEKQSSRRA